MSHMRLTSGTDPSTALCDTTITTGLVRDVADVTCRPCRDETYRLISEAEAEADRDD